MIAVRVANLELFVALYIHTNYFSAARLLVALYAAYHKRCDDALHRILVGSLPNKGHLPASLPACLYSVCPNERLCRRLASDDKQLANMKKSKTPNLAAV